ncbi:phosphoenolpyruvate--protein phosphotransferase [Sphingomonas sp. HT-1]|uniref:phosphoenolpyruvate--protein phosphotransferase n=1 Tax=unclassified Sphingomonas TaxID=196159 RepID=UPI000303C6AC|nr:MULTISPECIES: phosphoenolpyruvate--protein phosphotransferase [unclassified Sphingomonas]KTF68603.1 PTS galactitol transporter subunit IIC [Sphingomonas sp. WG]
MAGWLMPLEEVPDPVFAQRMLGDGVAIDPVEGCLYAPCDGEVSVLQPTGHAITLRAGDAIEVLMHIGIDTVQLAGKGFEPEVKVGDRVRRGDVLIRFDLDAVVCGAPSVVTPVLVIRQDGVELSPSHLSGMVSPGDVLFTVARAAPEIKAAAGPEGPLFSRDVVVPLAHGIHARPAAKLREALVPFDAKVTIAKGERSADARSPVGLMTLAIKLGDTIRIEAYGPIGAKAVETLAAMIESGMGEKADPATASRPVPTPAAPIAIATDEPGLLAGVSAAPGLAIGAARFFRLPEIEIDPIGKGDGVERASLMDGLAKVSRAIEGELAHASGPMRSILSAHRAMLDDPELLAAASDAIGQGASAAQAWREALRPQADLLRTSGDPHLAERADDMVDLERRVVAAIAGVGDAPLAFPVGTILLADDLLPSQVSAIDPAQVRGFCTVGGGPTSHVAILAASLGIPALVAMGPALRGVREGETVILDSGAGTLRVAPNDAQRAEAQARVDARAAALAAARSAASAACHLADGTRIEVFANLGSASDAVRAVATGAEGSGLLRTEFLFLDRDTAPSVAEQTAEYQAIADALDGRPLIIRLLDIGGDKPAPYLPIGAEENPALGLRGIRVGLAHPKILEDQLRAILGVRPIGQARIMLPMIASIGELRAVRAVLDRLRAELGIEERVELGIMVETPAAAATADLLATEADFLSIGTNDLTQYALAMDRGNPAVASGIDGLHPAVLRLIADTCRGAATQNRWVGVCGGLASDPLAVPILIGLGVTELSATVAVVPEVKAVLAGLTLERARAHAAAALACATAADVRRLAREFTA